MQVSYMCSLLEGSKRWTLSFQEVDKVKWLQNITLQLTRLILVYSGFERLINDIWT